MYNKINRISFYLILIAVFFIQLTLADHIKIANAKPDLPLIFIIFFAIFFGFQAGLEAGFFSGLLKDIFSVDIFGINTITLALTGFIAGILSPKLFKESRITQFFIVFAFSLFSFFIHFFIAPLISNVAYASFSEYLFSLFIPASLYTAFLSAIIFPILINKYALKEDEEYL